MLLLFLAVTISTRASYRLADSDRATPSNVVRLRDVRDGVRDVVLRVVWVNGDVVARRFVYQVGGPILWEGVGNRAYDYRRCGGEGFPS